MDDELDLAVLERLAKIVSEEYTGTGITDLFRRAGFGTIRHDGSTKQKFLYATFEGMQGKFGPKGILKVLKVACSPQEELNRPGVRSRINECLAFSGLEIGEDGEIIKIKRAKTPTGGNSSMFDQRGYHGFVVKHARAKFLQGDYFGAVGDCCREFEGLVRQASGLELSGRRLMGKALDPKKGIAGSLDNVLPNATRESRHGAQEETMHLAMGIMAGPRNSTAHESKANFPIGRDDALDKLTVLSYVLRQLERAGFGTGPASPTGDGSRTVGRGQRAGEPEPPEDGEPAGAVVHAARDGNGGSDALAGSRERRTLTREDSGGKATPVLVWAASEDGEPIGVYGDGSRPGGLRLRLVNAGQVSAEEIVAHLGARLVGDGAPPRLKTRRLGALGPGESIEVRIPMPMEDLGRALGGGMAYADAIFEYRGGGRDGLACRIAGYRSCTLSTLFAVDDTEIPHDGMRTGGEDRAAPEARDSADTDKAEAKRALAWAEKAVEEDPGDAVARRGVAAALRALGRHGEALREIDLAEKACRVDDRVLRERARILECLGRPDEAVWSLKRILERGHDDPCVHRELARLHTMLGSHDDAYSAWAAIAQNDPSYETYMSMAATRMVTRNYDSAAVAFGKAIDSRLNDAHAHVQKGMALTACGRYAEAAATLRRAVALGTGSAEAHANLAYALYRMGQEGDAREELRLAVEAEPDNHLAHMGRGVISLEMGLPGEAGESFAAARRLDPTMRVPHAGSGAYGGRKK